MVLEAGHPPIGTAKLTDFFFFLPTTMEGHFLKGGGLFKKIKFHRLGTIQILRNALEWDGVRSFVTFCYVNRREGPNYHSLPDCV